MNQLHFYRAGSIERGRYYSWRDGYSEVTPGGLSTYPWLTKEEARKEARKRGAQARFHDTIKEVISGNQRNTPGVGSPVRR